MAGSVRRSGTRYKRIKTVSEGWPEAEELRRELGEEKLVGKLRKWNEGVDENVQDLRNYINTNFSSKHLGYFYSRFEGIRETHREMLEEFARVTGIFKLMIGFELLMRERVRGEDERIGRIEENIIDRIDQSNKQVAEKVSVKVNGCMTFMEHEKTDRRNETDHIKKAIRETRKSMKEEIESMAQNSWRNEEEYDIIDGKKNDWIYG